ncbi:girdin-like [Anneissia japonica]|uniref:girdin-like n=1 Tax=Anneissia japonica TaxID=1529436 RepID=UPI001425AA80|nr:girdin-like [Anneissia japonica]
MTTTVEEFMEHALVVWVKTVSKDGGSLNYANLIDGKYLNAVMAKINCRSSDVSVSNELNGEVNSRIQNLDRLLKSIKVYYQDNLEQLVVMELPRIFTIAKDPVSEEAFGEIQKLLLLLLGCAVQCELKQDFIEGIKLLDINVQHAIVNHIQEITDNNENVCSLNWGDFADLSMEQLDLQSRNMFNQMKRLVKERDNYSETIMELSQEKDFLQVQMEGRKSISPPMSPTANRHQLTVELAETKAKLRRTRQEMEDKSEQALEYKEELEKFGQQLLKLRQENLTLMQDARSARIYRDELDALKEQASKVDKYENEISKYRERLNEMEYVKRRVEELRQDNQLLHETNALLQDQVETFQSKGDRIRELEADLLRYKSQIDNLQEQREADNDKLQELIEENARLQMDHRQSLNESASLGHELEMAKLVSPSGNSLSKEYNDSASSKILKLERENQKLLSELQTLQESFQTDSKSKLLEKENERLCRKVEKLQAASSSEMQNFLELETENSNLKKEKGQLEEAMQTAKEMSERQLKEQELENEQLTQTIETLRERNQKNVDHRIRDIENENRKLHEEMKESQSKLSKVEYDNKQLQKTLDKLKDNANRLEELQKTHSDSVRENDKLSRTVDMLNIRCDRFEELEHENSVLEVQKEKMENEKLQQERSLTELRVHCQKLEQYEADNVQLRSRLQTLQKTLDTMKDNMSKVLELEHDKEELDRQNRQLQKSIEALKSSQERGSQLEVDYIELETQNKQLQKSIELNKMKIEKLEKENQELDNHVERLKEDLKKSSESLKLSSKMVEDLEKDNRTLELEKETVEKDKRRLDKENTRLKMSLEGKDSEIDEASTKIATLQREVKHVQKSAEKNKEIAERVKELEAENRDLVKQSTLDKKTLATLREELVNEKIRTQQLDNDLEKLSTELDRIGLNKDKLLREELREDESRYKALQSQMEDTLNRSLEIKEEKIKALEQRGRELRSLGAENETEGSLMCIRDRVKREYSSLQQRTLEEETGNSMEEPGRASVKRTDSDKIHAKQIIQMKDHLVELERENATLLAENTNLKSQNETFITQTTTLQTDNKSFQSKINSLQDQNSNLQSQYAKLQVEQATIGSQNSTLQSQNSHLQSRLSKLELEEEQSKSKLEDMDKTYESLLGNYDQLTQLHESLNSEYESLINEHSALKGEMKTVKSAFENKKVQCEEMEKKKEDMLLLQSSLRQEEDTLRKMKRERSSATLERDHESLQHIHKRLKKEYEELEEKHNTVKGKYRTLQRDHTVLQGELHDAKDRCQQMDIETTKIAHRCEMLNHLNGNLEEENKKLMEQLSQLMAQNQELLVSTLESKELHHEEQKQLVEKLNNLRRQKEKLEEKIMDQYKTSPPKSGTLSLESELSYQNTLCSWNKGGGISGLLKRIHKPRNKEKSKKERKYSLGNDSLDCAMDSPGETSSIGSGGGESIDGIAVEAVRQPADTDIVMSDDDLGNQSYIRRKHNRSKASAQHRKSMPAYVHEAQREPVLQRKEAVHSSLSSEDLRMSKDDLDSLSSTSSTKRAPQARRSSFEQALEAYPSLNLSDAFPQDSDFADYEFERAQSLDDNCSPGSDRRGTKGLMSRIRSRSREILDDLRYNSASNLSKMDQSESQVSFPIEEPVMTSTIVQGEETSISTGATYSSGNRYSERLDLNITPPIPGASDDRINSSTNNSIISNMTYEDDLNDADINCSQYSNSRPNPGYNSPTHINSPQGPSSSTPRSNNLNPSVYAAIPYHKLTPTDRTTPPTITKKTPPVSHKVLQPKPRYPQNLNSPRTSTSSQENSPRESVNIPVDTVNIPSPRTPRDKIRHPPIGRNKSNAFSFEHSNSLPRKNSLPKQVYEKPAKIYGSESNLASNSTKVTPGDCKGKGKVPTKSLEDANNSIDNSKDAKKENSIWYEYGCV